MDQIKSYADERLISGCIYCGGLGETREHVPSKVFLDLPLPENLPIMYACRVCNNGFSLDEEYFACLIESVIAGSADPECIRRPEVAKILRRSPALQAKIAGAKVSSDGQTFFVVEQERVRNVLVKLARGHAAFELSQPCRGDPSSIWWQPLALMTEEQLECFEASQVAQTFGEIGSRGMQRLLITQFILNNSEGEASVIELMINDWVDVQEGRYRYHAIDDGNVVRIKIVIGEYLASEVTWTMY